MVRAILLLLLVIKKNTLHRRLCSLNIEYQPFTYTAFTCSCLYIARNIHLFSIDCPVLESMLVTFCDLFWISFILLLNISKISCSFVFWFDIKSNDFSCQSYDNGCLLESRVQFTKIYIIFFIQYLIVYIIFTVNNNHKSQGSVVKKLNLIAVVVNNF